MFLKVILGAMNERKGGQYLKAAVFVPICTAAASFYHLPGFGALSESITANTRVSTGIAARELFSTGGKIIMHCDSAIQQCTLKSADPRDRIKSILVGPTPRFAAEYEPRQMRGLSISGSRLHAWRRLSA